MRSLRTKLYKQFIIKVILFIKNFIIKRKLNAIRKFLNNIFYLEKSMKNKFSKL